MGIGHCQERHASIVNVVIWHHKNIATAKTTFSNVYIDRIRLGLVACLLSWIFFGVDFVLLLRLGAALLEPFVTSISVIFVQLALCHF